MPSISRSSASGRNSISLIRESATRGELVLVVGTGVSISLTDGLVPALSWKGLIENGFEYGLRKGRITENQVENWKTQIASQDIDDLLCAAEFLGRKLDAPDGDLYARWLREAVGNARPTNSELENALKGLQKLGVPICTLNYDGLLESVTGLQAITLSDTARSMSWVRREMPGVLHLHGSWDAAGTCILGIRDYTTALTSEVRELIQRSLSSFRRLLFVGCGDTFADPNFSALVKWMRTNLKTAALEHFALVRNADLPARESDQSWQGFVEPIGYGDTYASLPSFFAEHFPLGAKKRVKRVKRSASPPDGDRLVSHYCEFLLADCGQMAIEGVRADMEIGQRKFDIEKLFVPLNVLPFPPDIPLTDPQRAQMLREWKEKNEKPRAFGSVFRRQRRLALLALPGGGKTLLLKRLAVAYATPGRRAASQDNLPALDVIPVLIRCREWRDYIHYPILTILQNLPDITGDVRLAGLSEALIPLFKEGRVLLLVDGLDEIHNDAHRAIFVEHLEKFLDEYEKTRFIVTSREAGFGLVAPSIARFCTRYRVAPLSEDAISALCNHWQRLMSGDTPASMAEGAEIAQTILRSASLRRLGENPLLLTMLLVVKHGAGRLPPDRVSLYGRAVEVLLDTWNIKGHDPLNPKEAVPQLSYVAFEMMKAGKQTATEAELLSLLEESRDKVPQIRRYAKDAPHEFLKRVELRSSLLFEGGHQVEAGRAVPFYQFRHLTFQEYLAAVAAAEGHYDNYDKDDSVLNPLSTYLTTEGWKEVVPMAAVLARKQAEPLIAALVGLGNELKKIRLENPATWSEYELSQTGVPRMPSQIARILTCLVEEAEAAPETLASALHLIVFFARGANSNEDWPSLVRGPYGKELLNQTWLLYSGMNWPNGCELPGTYFRFADLRLRVETDRDAILTDLLQSTDPEGLCLALYAIAATRAKRSQQNLRPNTRLVGLAERHLFSEEESVCLAAAFAIAHWWHFGERTAATEPTSNVLDRLLWLRLNASHEHTAMWGAMAIAEQPWLNRGSWKPTLSEKEASIIRAALEATPEDPANQYSRFGDVVVAFHSRDLLPEDRLAELVVESVPGFQNLAGERSNPATHMLEQLGASGQKQIRRRAAKSHARNRRG
jgi:hypothetical protein